MEHETRNATGPTAEGWNPQGNLEAASSQAEKGKKDKKKKGVLTPISGTILGSDASAKAPQPVQESAAVTAWQRLAKDKETIAPAPKVDAKLDQPVGPPAEPTPANVLDFPVERAKARAESGEPTDNDKPAEVISLDERRQAKAAENRPPDASQPEYAIAAGAEPPLTPPPLAAWMQGGPQGNRLRLPEMRQGDNGDNSGEQPPERQSQQDYQFGAELGRTTEMAGGSATTGGAAEKSGETSPGETMPLPTADPEAAERTDPGQPDIFTAPAGVKYRSAENTAVPSGYERTPEDVSRAAWMGLFFGWIVGRRGKNKAIARAVAAVERRFKKSRPAPVTAPRRSYETPATAPVATTAVEYQRPSPAWLRTENVSASANRLSTERLSAAPLAEVLAMPAAVVAAKMMAEKRRPVTGAHSEASMSDGQLIEMAKTIKVDGVPLHEVYQSKQIDKEGLRTVVEVYLRGGNVEKQLTQEVIEKQKMFERDPFNRKRSRGSLRQAVSQASGKIVEKSTDFARSSQRVAAKAGHAVMSNAEKAQENIAEGSDSRNWSGVAAIVIIYSLILFLLLV